MSRPRPDGGEEEPERDTEAGGCGLPESEISFSARPSLMDVALALEHGARPERGAHRVERAFGDDGLRGLRQDRLTI